MRGCSIWALALVGVLFLVSTTTSFCDAHSLSGASEDGTPAESFSSKHIIYLEKESHIDDVVALANLILVILFFVLSVKDRKKERKEDARRTMVSFWVQDVIAKPNMALIQGYFESADQMLAVHPGRDASVAADIEASKEDIRTFKKLHHALNNEVIEPLLMVNSEFKCLSDVMDDIEDLMTTTLDHVCISGTPPADGKRPDQKLRFLKSDFFKKFLATHRKVVDVE